MMKFRKSFALRIDPDLYAALENWAQQEFRSVNGQIEFLLREAVRRRRGARGAGTAGQPSEPRSESGSDHGL